MYQGFEIPKSNFFKVPTIWFDTFLPKLRHTWGYQEYGIAKHITIDEFMDGRRRKDGTRLDCGTGLSKGGISQGLRKAMEDGFVICYVDNTDPGRIKRYFMLRMNSNVPPEVFAVNKDTGERTSYDEWIQMASSDEYTGDNDCKHEKEGGTKNEPSLSKNEHGGIKNEPGGSKNIPRTIERYYKKDTYNNNIYDSVSQSSIDRESEKTEDRQTEEEKDIEIFNKILDSCCPEFFDEPEAIRGALEDMYFGKSFTEKYGVPEQIIKERMKKLHHDIVKYAVYKMERAAADGTEIRNSLRYLQVCIYNAISEYESDLIADEYLARLKMDRRASDRIRDQ